MTKAFVQNHTAKTQFFLLSNEKKKRSKYHLTENVGIQGKEKKFKRSEQKIFIKIIVTIDNWILEALAFTENKKVFYGLFWASPLKIDLISLQEPSSFVYSSAM